MDKPVITYLRRTAGLVLAAACALCLPQTAHAQNRTITVVNQCNQEIWPGIFEEGIDGNPTPNPQPMNGGWALPAGQSTVLTLPAGFSGRIWARKDCTFNAQGVGSCETGGCGGLNCNGATGLAGTSLAEFTMYQPNDLSAFPDDWYDVSYVDGYDFPIAIIPSNVTYMAPSVAYDMLPTCPAGQQIKNASGLVVQCLSACVAYGTNSAVPTAVQEVYCCLPPYAGGSLCNPSNFPAVPGDLDGPFKSAAPNSYSWSDDDPTSVWHYSGDSTVTYQVVFCPTNGSGTVVQTSGTGSYDGPTTILGTWNGTFAVPATPAGLSAVAGSAQVSLTWAAVSGNTTYNVYRGTSSGGESATAIASTVNASYVDTTATNGTTFYYKVAALDLAGTSGMSNEASAAPVAAAPPAPAGLIATAGIGQVGLSWTAAASTTSYNVYRGTASGGESATAVATAITGTIYTDTTVANGVTYYYEVAGVNATGTSSKSNEASATPNSGPPPSPSSLTATAGNAQVALTWATDTGAASYNVYRGTASGAESTTPIATGVTATAYTNTGLTNGTAYYFEVSAVNSSGTSGMSNEASATPSSSPPAAPTGLTATAGNAQVALSWTGSSGATSYNVYRGTASGGESATPIATAISTTSYTNTGLTNGAAYYFKVAAVDANGTSAESSEASATPVASVPPAPTGLTATSGAAQVALSWTASSSATSYNVFRGTASGGESATAIATAITTTTYTNTGLTNGTAYYYKVAAVNSTGTSAQSNEASATPEAAGSMVIGINCGGSASGSWVADTDFAAGGGTAGTSSTVTTTGVTNPAPMAVYQSNRYNAPSYTIGGLTANGSYVVRLHFAESYWTAIGDREFNVLINGTQVLTDFDIFKTAGGENIANIQQFNATANASGQIVITSVNVVDNAQFNGVEIDN